MNGVHGYKRYCTFCENHYILLMRGMQAPETVERLRVGFIELKSKSTVDRCGDRYKAAGGSLKDDKI